MWEWNEGWDSTSSRDRFPEADKRPWECCSSGLTTPAPFGVAPCVAEVAKAWEGARSQDEQPWVWVCCHHSDTPLPSSLCIQPPGLRPTSRLRYQPPCSPPAPADGKFKSEGVENCGAGAVNNCEYEQTRDVTAGEAVPWCDQTGEWERKHKFGAGSPDPSFPAGPWSGCCMLFSFPLDAICTYRLKGQPRKQTMSWPASSEEEQQEGNCTKLTSKFHTGLQDAASITDSRCEEAGSGFVSQV
ncbi:uncharacterized protein LOC108638722 [Manacus vitellinus]|uniref:uncharacterized protein LOC108638722 n=1 Tax=Manacus vitellinus TaxID=328815 RepID=UPI00115D91DD|nr:uncharacterized protein LOC108638722 [Manacus vitellinus]